MPSVDLYSRRRERELGTELPDVYSYDAIPNPFRVQVTHILNSALGNASAFGDHRWDGPKQAYNYIVDTLRREYGVLNLGGNQHDAYRDLHYFIQNAGRATHVLDAVELSFRIVERFARDRDYMGKTDQQEVAEDAIAELNTRFMQHGLGYKYEQGRIIRIDSEVIHSSAVKPALSMLSAKMYEGANQEFLAAFEHYRHNRTKETLTDCLKAFESTMKAICAKRGWTVNGNGTAKDLIKACLENGLVPSFWEGQIGNLRALLEGSIPTGRNRLSGHGQGQVEQVVPQHFAAFMLHMTASTILFLSQADQALGKP